MMQKTQKILITGVQGQLGKKVFSLLKDQPYVLGTCRDHEGVDDNIEFLDLTDEHSIRGVCQDFRPNIIINCAAYTNVDAAETESVLNHRANGVAPGILAEEAKNLDSLLIHISTDYVFDGSGDNAFDETDIPSPLSAYGEAKWFGEKQIKSVGCRHLILRTSWVYGADGKNFLNTMLRLAKTHGQLKIVDDQIGAPTSVDEIAKVILFLVDAYEKQPHFISGVFHCACMGETSWFGFADAIFTLQTELEQDFQKPHLIPIPSSDYPTPAVRPLNSRLNCEKLKKVFGVGLVGWEQALRDVMKKKKGKKGTPDCTR